MPLMGSATSRPDEAAVQARIFKALHEVALAASGVLDPAELARLAVDHARDLVGGWSATLVWFESGDQVQVLADNHPIAFPTEDLAPRQGMTGQILLTGEMIVVDDYPAWEHAFEWAIEGGIKSMIGVPLKVQDKPVGCLMVRSHQLAFFEDEIRDVLSLLAAQVTPTIYAASLSAARQDQAKLFRALHELAVAASGLLEPGELAKVAVERCRELLEVDGTVIFHFDHQTGYLEPLHETSAGVMEKQLKPGEGAVGLAFSNRRPYAVDDYATWELRMEGPSNRGLAAGLSYPLIAGDQAIGVVGVWSRTKRAWTENEIQILSLVAAQIGPALQTATVAKERENQAEVFRTLTEAALAAAESVRESEGRNSAIVESALDCIVAADDRGCIIEFNPAAERTFGFKRDDVLGRGLWDTIIPPRLRSALEIGRRFETMGLRADGSEFPVELSVAAFMQDGKKMLSASIRDLTEREHAETMRQESEAKSRFVAAMSHELRTPLNSILGFSQLLESSGSGQLNERQQRYVGHIESSGRHLLALINDVLDLSKVEAGQMEVELEPIELQPLLEEAINQLRPLADVKRLDLLLDPTPTLWIRADRRRFMQVLLNLLSNAIKFTEAGGLVRVSATRAGRTAEISVIDTGIGIPLEQQQRIFEEFTQVERQATQTAEGTGLGLALSRRLLQLMLGTIQVVSQEGEGSTFLVTIPRIRPSEVADARPLLLVVHGAVPDPALLVQLESGPYRLIASETAREAALIARRRRLAGIVIGESVSQDEEDWLRTALRDNPRTHTLPILSAAVALHPGVLIRD
jgi:PAS domain S-box-containing protein